MSAESLTSWKAVCASRAEALRSTEIRLVRKLSLPEERAKIAATDSEVLKRMANENLLFRFFGWLLRLALTGRMRNLDKLYGEEFDEWLNAHWRPDDELWEFYLETTIDLYSGYAVVRGSDVVSRLIRLQCLLREEN